MLEYPGFCYLDVQKTGSTFVTEFLLRHASGAPLNFVEHARARPRKGVFYFTTCRAPLPLYRSLYAFGCEGRGAFHRFQVETDTPLAATYTGGPEGFRDWLDLVLSDARAEYSPQGQAGYHNPILGLMTLRFLRLTLKTPMSTVPPARSRAAVSALWKLRRMPEAVLRQEHLADDLAALVRGRLGPFLRDPDAALADLATAARVNASALSGSALSDGVTEATLSRLRTLEWFFHRHLGYD